MGSPPVTPWAWPTWALCVTRLVAVLSWRMTGSNQPSLLLTNWVLGVQGRGTVVSGMGERCGRGEARGQ